MLFRIVLDTLIFLFLVAIRAKTRSVAPRQWLLLAGSYVLYASWGGWFAAVLVASTLMNFFLGKWLQRNPSRLALTQGILLNVALLGTFKYLPELTLSWPLPSMQRFAHLALPLGISFWTFQAMSYLFDLYRGEELKPTLPEFALYMAFFPVAIAGPVCRMPDMLPQFRSDERTSASNLGRGLSRIAIGVLMMLLARLLGQGILSGDGINSGFDHATQWSGTDVWCLAFGYGLQLFFDFAGYSHIAIGAAKALGITVPENFSRPFESTTPSIFWARWHMSLSSWIRDYVFLPLAVLRREVWWRNLALLISMILFGVWHKATVLFVLWGCYHGVLLFLHRQVQALERRFDWNPGEGLWTPLSWVSTISLVSLGWIFFRANSLDQARAMITAVLSPANYSIHFLSGTLYLLVCGLGVGYAILSLVIKAFDRQVEEGERSSLIAAAVRYRWYWIPGLYICALLTLLAITYTRATDAAQLMYRNF